MKIESLLASKKLSFNHFHVLCRLVLTFCLAGATARAANLALVGTASQSSDYSALGLAYKASDGNRDGVFSDGSVSHTIQPSLTNEWWIVDLGGVKPVDSVTLWNRSDCCGNRMSNLRVALLDGSNNEVYGVNITNGNAVAQGGARGFAMPFGAQGRYVRVLSLSGTNMDGNKIIALAEVEVWGHNTYTNVARNPLAVATQSSTISPASDAIDGNTDPIFADGSVSQTDPAVTSGTYWEVNLGSLCVINEIWLFNRNDLGANLSNFRVSVFGTNNNEVFATNCLVGSGSVPNGGTFNIALSTPAEGTRVRVALLNNTNNAGNSILALTEAQVYGTLGADLTPPQLVNVVNFGTNRLFVQFSEPVTVDTATNPANRRPSMPGGRK
ncbi:MAG: discoidin domain-containing protein [Verrucomicrobia bacterium]|nr:discoidin domain-containing protein [Verrucomicrobiota bacterium]